MDRKKELMKLLEDAKKQSESYWLYLDAEHELEVVLDRQIAILKALIEGEE